MKRFAILSTTLMLLTQTPLVSHCQMPCGIYHDNMVYDQIDQYVETMYKAVSEIDQINPTTPKDRNQLIRWVYQKEVQSDEVAKLITVYFLQQKIKPGEQDTVNKLVTHKLLFLIVQIKQNVERKLVYEFMEEWEKFKHMFHREGYECRIEEMKLKKWQEEHEKLKQEALKDNNKEDSKSNSVQSP